MWKSNLFPRNQIYFSNTLSFTKTWIEANNLNLWHKTIKSIFDMVLYTEPIKMLQTPVLQGK